MAKTRLAILGCTGSVGRQAVEVALSLRDTFEITALSARKDSAGLLRAAARTGAACLGLAQASTAFDAPAKCELYMGDDCNARICARDDVDMALIAVSGMEGVFALLSAIRHGKKIALANKESLVCAGEVIKRELAQHGGMIIPVDSEHSAIFQCLQGINRGELDKLLLTASGGAFRDYTAEQLASATPEQALKHPNWSMGKKITIDCATLANKGLEVMEAHYLFGCPADKIEVLIHPQSVVHSLVQTVDGSVLAQLGAPDMRLPIQYALTYPRRAPSIAKKLDLLSAGRLDFYPPDTARFPALALAYDALNAGGAAPAVYNAANEQAVELFLQKRISYNELAQSIACALDCVQQSDGSSLDCVLEADARARAIVKKRAGIG